MWEKKALGLAFTKIYFIAKRGLKIDPWGGSSFPFVYTAHKVISITTRK